MTDRTKHFLTIFYFSNKVIVTTPFQFSMYYYIYKREYYI